MQIYICIIQYYDYNITLNTMDLTTRKRILTSIKKHQMVTVSDICLYLDLNPANIRHHLSILKDEGLIEEMETRPRSGRGRPETVYSVSRAFKEDGLDNLMCGILRIWRVAKTEEALYKNIRELARQLAGSVGEKQYSTTTKRLSICVDHLNDLHYQAQWEASPIGPRIRLRNCPYWKVIKQYPELCIMDGNLIEELSGLKINQTSKLERDERGLFECSFIGY
jgi:predicted ArsR family transcriptional regulator